MEGILPPKRNTRKWLIWSMLGVLSLAGAGIIFYATRWGAIAYSDSTLYLLSARSLVAGKGLGIPAPGGGFEALRLHPPLYPIVLAGIDLLGFELQEGARLLAVCSFALLIFLVGMINYRLSRQVLLSLLLSAVFVVSPVFISIFSMAMSESLFYLTGLLVLFLVLLHLEQPQSARLAVAGVLGGLSFLSRYTGVTWVIAGCLALLIFRRVKWNQRLIECLWLALPATALSILWLVPLSLDTSTMASRTFQFSFDLGVEFQTTKATLIDMAWRWVPFAEILLPTRSYALRGGLMLAGIALLGVLTLFSIWRLGKRDGKNAADGGAESRFPRPTGDAAATSSQAQEGLFRLGGVLVLFTGTYLAMTIFSYLFAVPRSDLNERLLSPVYLMGVWLGMALLRWIAYGLPAIPARLVMGLALLLPLLLVVDGARRSREIVVDLHEHGAGYTSPGWQNSEVIQALRQIPPGLELISNQSTAILFLTNRPAYDLAELYLSQPLETFTRYGDGLPATAGSAERLFRQGKAALVIFPASLYWQLFPIYGERTQERLEAMFNGLVEYQVLQDGAIYLYPDD